MVLTVKGKAEAIVQDAEAYQRLLDIAARADVYEAVRQGLDDVAGDGGVVGDAAAHGLPGKCLTRFAGNMTYCVEFTARAARNLAILYEEKRAGELAAAARWFKRF